VNNNRFPVTSPIDWTLNFNRALILGAEIGLGARFRGRLLTTR
jgi:hypothetical protein